MLVLGAAHRDGDAGMTEAGGGKRNKAKAAKARGLAGLIRFANDGSFALIWRLLRDTGRHFAGRYAIVFGLGALTAATAAVNAWLIKDVINEVFLAHRVEFLYFITAVVLVNGMVRAGSIYFSQITLGAIGNAIVGRLQKRMFAHLLSLGADYYARTPSSELVTRMSHNATAARKVLDTVFTSTGRDLLSLIALVGVMVIQSPQLSLIVLVIGPLTVFTINQLTRRVKKVARKQFGSLGTLVGQMQQAATAIRVIKAFNLEDAVKKRMGESIDRVRAHNNKIVRIRARAVPFSEVLAAVAIGFVMFYAGYRTITFGEPPGAFFSFIAAMAFAYDPAKRLANAQVPLVADLVGVKLMFDLLDTRPAMEVNTSGPKLQVTKGEVVFERVDFTYPGGAEVIRGLDFVAAGGRTTALVGPSGGGKSTMIALIERFFDVAGGRILVDGQDIAKVELTSLRDSMALVMQDTVLFNDTIRENIRFGRASATDAEVEAAARSALAHEFIMGTPRGYATIIGDGAAGLSGGQRQRIAIARAMLRNAPILLLDEATSSLDSESEHQVQLALDRLMRDRTTIVIAHRLSTVLGADKIAVLIDGRIVEAGRHSDLLQRDGHYARLYHLQFEPRAKDAAVAAE
jgi:ATP-binding cassette subfamily B protein